MITFYIEMDCTIPKFKQDYIVQKANNNTPYQGLFSCCEVTIKKEELGKFLKKVRGSKKDKSIRKIYLKQGNQYIPMINLHPEDYLLYTTFFYKNLNNSESKEERLENLVIETKSSDFVRGYYRTTKWNDENTKIEKENSGIFQVSNEKSGIDNIVHIFMQNALLREKQSPIVREFESKEYYYSFTDKIILHFAENIETVEVYAKINEEMSLIPFKTFNKNKKDLKKQEQLYLENINHFLQEQSNTRKRK